MLSNVKYKNILDKKESGLIDLLNKIAPEIVKTNANEFFNVHRNKYILIYISNFLSFYDKINFIYLNKFLKSISNHIIDRSVFNIFKQKIMDLLSKNFSINDLL